MDSMTRLKPSARIGDVFGVAAKPCDVVEPERMSPLSLGMRVRLIDGGRITPDETP
jgi:hypothetical protein